VEQERVIHMGLLIEALVSILLVVTITYCIRLERQLGRLRSDDTAMRKTIADLSLAADRAEVAIAGLRRTTVEGEKGLGERLREVEVVSAALARETANGETVLARIAQIVTSQRVQADVGKARDLQEQLQSRTDGQRSSLSSEPSLPSNDVSSPVRLEKLSGAAQAARELARRVSDVTAEAA
jgi:hypothetical protein